jgi:2-polyprenyl-3-methyl-5-hydroxy-6-metoxy-1,4-benzoquinol methylase
MPQIDQETSNAFSELPASFAYRMNGWRPYVAVRAALKRWSHRGTGHDDVYGKDYFQMVDRTTGLSANIMADSIVRHLQPASVIDFGCGTGNLLECMRARNVKVQGLEFAEAALAFCRRRKLAVKKIDFTDPDAITKPLGSFDLAVSVEVAIQLPSTAARRHIAYLCKHADTVLFSSPPCARDRLPKSARSAEYWIAQFEKQGFHYEEELSQILKKEWIEKGTAPWFHRKPMIFRRKLAD